MKNEYFYAIKDYQGGTVTDTCPHDAMLYHLENFAAEEMPEEVTVVEWAPMEIGQVCIDSITDSIIKAWEDLHEYFHVSEDDTTDPPPSIVRDAKRLAASMASEYDVTVLEETGREITWYTAFWIQTHCSEWLCDEPVRAYVDGFVERAWEKARKEEDF